MSKFNLGVEKMKRPSKGINAEWRITLDGRFVGVVEKRKAAPTEPLQYFSIALAPDAKSARTFGPFDLSQEGFAIAVSAVCDEQRTK